MDQPDNPQIKELLGRLANIERMLNEVRALVGPFGVSFPDGSMLVQTLHGLKYYIDPQDEIMAPQLIIYRQWEPDLSAFVANAMTPDTVFVDVGANFGYFTCLAAARIGLRGKGRVFAAEPNPKMLGLLRKNIRVNWSMAPVEVFGGAVTAQAGFVQFNVPAGRAANASIATAGATFEDTQFIVRADSLDNVLGQVVVDLMKIDVEGFEIGVLRGARNTISRSPDIKIVIEWSLGQILATGSTIEELFSLFRECNLTAHRIPLAPAKGEAEWKSLELSEADLRKISYSNIILKRRKNDPATV